MAVFPQGFDATLAGHLKTEELVEWNIARTIGP
jgi:hypothetical protein